MSDTFWLNNPLILVNKKQITEIFPIGNLSYTRKLNALTRIIIICSILGYLMTKSAKILISAAVTIVIVAMIYKIQKHKNAKDKINTKDLKEGFANCNNYNKHKEKFTQPTKTNPLMNVLLPEINDNPKRKPAAPAFNRTVEKKINAKAKNIGHYPRLFLDLGDSINFEQSMRNFYSTPNTKVGNDQTAFAKYLYGDMPSCKDGDELQCMKNNERYTLF